MPNHRMPKARQTGSPPRPCGIIPVTALWALCRYRHKGHWSGHKKRLDRQFGTRFGDQAYAFEELVADIASAILGASLGLPEAQLDNHAAYVAHWVKVLKSDKNAFLTAASKADEAVDYIVGFGQAAATRMVEHDRPLLVAA